MSGNPCELGRIVGPASGPTLILIGGMHGNEPAGALAAEATLVHLERDATPVAGEVIALQGNRPAMRENRRYLRRDLNRQWTPARLASAHDAVAAGDPDPELQALLDVEDAIDAALARARGPVYALDLHTTSAEGIPFAIVGPSLAEQSFARDFGLTGIMGLEVALEGVLSTYLATRGCIALSIEGGQHDGAPALRNLHAAATIAVQAAGLVHARDLPGLAAARRKLARARGKLPALIEVTYRHEIQPGRHFRMAPGFATIQRVLAGTVLAHEEAAEIRAPFDGLVVLPLYQPQGSDGFFYGREVTPRTA